MRPKGGRVLDVSAGRGAFTEWLTEYGYCPVAIGLTAGQNKFGGAPFVVADVDRGYSVSDGSVEGTVAIELIKHLVQPSKLIRKAARCLVMNGLLILTTPTGLSFASKLSLLSRNYPLCFGPRDYVGNGHLSPISRTKLHRIASREGLTIESTTYNAGKCPIPRLRHRVSLTHPLFTSEFWSESLILRLRKTSGWLRSSIEAEDTEQTLLIDFRGAPMLIEAIQ